MEKQCIKCGEIKPLSGFYKHPHMKDGRVNKCKECNKRDVRDNRAKRVDYYREYDRARNGDRSRVEQRAAYGNAYKKNYPIKCGAHCIVNNAVRDGRLTKQSSCAECGASNRVIHAHHDDYARPLDVRWLCVPCHRAWHDKNGPGINGD